MTDVTYQIMEAPERDGIPNIGGFSDAVFNEIIAFLSTRCQVYSDS